MTRTRKLLLVLLLVVLLVVALPAGWFAWRCRRALPAYDGEQPLAGLQQPVRVLRDERAVPHLYAGNLDDLFFAQGYVHAQERLWQMDLLRRQARGQLAEIFGRAAIELDKENRLLGLGSVADRGVENLDDETRAQLQAYARGVNAYIESRSGPLAFSGLPIEFVLLGYRPEPWQPGDSLGVALNMYKLLTTSWPREMNRARVSERVGDERAADLYVTRSAEDRPIAEPVAAPRRPPRERVFVALDCRHSFSLADSSENLGYGARPVPARLGQSFGGATAWQEAGKYGASNNWVVAGSRTASGAPLLADDMHLPHTVPSIWFINHLQSPEVDVAGFSLPGLPWVIVGHNQRIAWGFTNSNADVQDLFIERFDPENPSLYMTPTGWQAVQRRVEHINIRGGEVEDFEVLETRHGPIVHEDGAAKLALQWIALDAANLAFSFLALNQAQGWDEFRQALARFAGPSQNVVYADADGNIGYHVFGRVPARRNGRGQVPVPGDTVHFDWVSVIPFEFLPHAFNPPTGALATANNRTVPDNYPYYITDQWMSPARIGRIYQLLEEDRRFTPEDFLRIQGDVVSLPEKALAAHLVAAGVATPTPHPADRAQALAALAEWDGAMGAEQAAPLIVITVRSQLMEALLRPHLGDDWRQYSWFNASVFLENVLSERPARWLPAGVESYEALLMAALDRALDQLRRETRLAAVSSLRWGEQWRVRFVHPVGDRIPFLRRWFSVSGRPQSGGPNSVKQTHRMAGVSQRMVVNFADLDQTLMNITLGESGHVASPHYRDQFEAWFEIRSFPAPFSDAAVERAARHRLNLVPQ
ncbi:MAG: penicillin acylase family protein [Candidatus Acidiferrales bacterium]